MRALIALFILFPILLQAQLLQKAKVLYETGKPAEALKLLEEIADDSKDYAEAQFYLGRIAFDKNEYDDAAEFFKEATEANDKNASYFDWLGNSYGLVARDANVIRQGFLAPKMKAAWEKAVELDPTLIDARLSLIQFYLQAPGFMGGSIDKAIETAKQVIKLDPLQGHRTLGNIYDREQKVVEAEKEFLEVVRIDPTSQPTLVNFYNNHKLYDKAFKLLDQSLVKNPDDMAAAYQFARVCAISGKNLDRGEQYLKKYLIYSPKENEPSHAGAYMRLGMICEKRGNKTEAKRNYQKALQLDKKMKEAEEGLERVSK